MKALDDLDRLWKGGASAPVRERQEALGAALELVEAKPTSLESCTFVEDAKQGVSTKWTVRAS